ncbi:hypothetical protein Tco_1575473 [Tanacetum coccineum]
MPASRPTIPDYVPGPEHPASPLTMRSLSRVMSVRREEHRCLPAGLSGIFTVVDPVPSAGDTEAFETDESATTPRPPQIRIPFAPNQTNIL